LRIEGHTDDAPIHNSQFASNWELSASRATEIVRLLIVRDGFSPEHLSAAGFAQYHPVATNRTLEGRGMNRRVDVVILGHASASPPPAAEAVSRDAPGVTPSPAGAGTRSDKPSPAVSLHPAALAAPGPPSQH
jgi:chemotaxis protein MotB